ncbi:bicoid stability factor [Lycorma delicatula]|uniref:bicoid stability factor n=1 Tax=Lycorma delicatula TaxID=130591 RepID=UPI003F5174B8
MSILRTSKFVKYIGSLARNIVLNNSRSVDGLLNKSQNFNFSHNFTTAAVAATTSHQQNENSVDRSIKRLDEDARRIGRISRRELEEVIEEIKLSKSATSSQSLMVIRCCGNLVPEETPEFRTKLVSNVWQILEKLGVPMDISHYNALLRVYLENEHQFSPTEFLSELERKGIEPNRVTYQRLIAGYCQKGDIDGATQILEFMREKQMPISEGVFNALILGHSKAGDMKSARGILNVMGQAGLEPSADTYSALLCGYACAGDSESLQAVFEECENKDIYLADRDYLEIVFSLAVNNHDTLVESVLKKVNHSFGYNQDATNVILRLANNGKENVAFQILETMQPPLKQDGQSAPIGGFFIRQIIKCNMPAEKILNICNMLKEKHLNSRPLLIATEIALQIGNTELALDLFKFMQAEMYPIRSHYFWPLIVNKGQDKKAVLEILSKMADFKVSPSYETLKDYVLPYIAPDDYNVSRLINELQSRNISVGSAAAALVGYLLSKKNIKLAADVATNYQANYTSAATRRVLVSAFLETNDVDSFTKLINVLVQSRENQQKIDGEEEDIGFDDREFVGRLLFGVVNKTSFSFAELLQKLLNLGLGISNSTAEQIQSKLSGAELTPEISELLSKLVSSELTPAPVQRRVRMAAIPRTEESLKTSIERLKAKGDPAVNLKRQLFAVLCQNRNVDKVVNFWKELESEGFTFTTGMYALLIELYLENNDLDSAVKEYERLLKNEPDIKLDNIKTIKLATGLVQANKLDDAVEFLKQQAREDDDIEKEKEKDRPFIYSAACWRLLNTLAEKGDSDGVRKLFDTLLENKFIVPNNALFGPLVKAHIVKDDIKGALDVFEWCCQHYRCTPFKNELACKLIQKEDAVELQRLTDLSTIVHGEINSLHDLILAFVECGRIRQARKILETPGLRVKSDRFSYAGERYQSEGLVEPLEALLKATKDILHVDRASLYYQLLLSYKKADDTEKAIGLWTQMQEEDVQPTDEFLYELGTFLERKNEPVPFVIPKLTPAAQQSVVAASSGTVQNLRNSLSYKSWSDALREYELLKKNNIKLYGSDISGFLELAINSISIKETYKYVKEFLKNNSPIPRNKLYYFSKQLAKSGDIELFEDFGNHLSEAQKKAVKYKNLNCNCYIEAGKTDELLDKFEKIIDSAETQNELDEIVGSFPNGGILGVLESSTRHLPRVETLAEKFANKGLLNISNILWMYYVKNHDYNKADEIFNTYLKSSPSLLFRYVKHSACNTKDEDIISKLLYYVKKWDHVTNRHVGLVYSATVDILVSKEEPEKALAVVEEALKDISLEDLNYTALNRLKNSLTAKEKEFPYSLHRTRHQQQNIEESTSSDSEADEVARKST